MSDPIDIPLMQQVQSFADWDDIEPTHRFIEPEEFKVFHFTDIENLPAFIVPPVLEGTYRRPHFRAYDPWSDYHPRINVGDWIVLLSTGMEIYTDEGFHKTFEVIP